LNFLDLFYQVSAQKIIHKSHKVFSNLIKITEAQYAAGSARQEDVLQAQLELLKLDDRLILIKYQEDRDRAALRQWINSAADKKIKRVFPKLPKLPTEKNIRLMLQKHAVIRVENAIIESQYQNVNVAREQYKPGFNIAGEYRKRFGNNPNGSNRTDQVTAVVTLDIPLFTKKRQDKRLSASQKQVNASRLDRDDKMRELREMLEREYANWRRLGERETLYKKKLLRESGSNVKALTNAYQNGIGDFTALLRSQLTDLNLRLQSLRIRVDRASARARLLYLASGK
jgi:outer membrane protein TolC